MSELKALQKIGGAGYVTIDEESHVALSTSRPYLNASEALSLKGFLEGVRPLLSVGIGVMRFGATIRIWAPEKALEQTPPAMRHLWYQQAGTLFNYGVIRTEPLGSIYSGGYTRERERFVLVPDELVRVRYRECILQVAREHTGSTDLQLLADFIEEAEYASSDDHEPEAYYGQEAMDRARVVDYWVQVAGDRSGSAFDSHDVRRTK